MSNPSNDGAAGQAAAGSQAAAGAEGGAAGAEGAQGAAGAAGEGGSLLSDEAAGGAGDGGAPPQGDDWMPEKFRVTGEDGKLDEAASARKLAESYRALESHKATPPPKSPEDYAIKIEGLDETGLATFKGDEKFKAFAKDAHAAGINDEQMNFIVNRYLDLAPDMQEAAATLTAEQARAELAKVWTDDTAMQQNLSSVVRAIKAFGAEAEDVPGARSRLMEKYGTDPDFIAFAASVAKELPEDKLPGGSAPSEDMDIAALQSSEAYWKADHPDHARTVKRVSDYYARKHGTQARRGGVAVAG